MRSLITVISLSIVFCSCVLADWSTPTLVTSVSSEWSESGATLSSDGLTMYFARGQTSTHSAFQIYTATRNSPAEDFGNVTRVPELISFEHVSYPSVSQDGLRLYYNYDWDIVYSDRASVSDPWGPRHFISELNAIGSVECLRLSSDGCSAVFDRANGPSGSYDLYVATRPDIDSPFTDIRALTELNTSGNDGCGYLSPDGLTLYYHSNYGGTWYIYKTTRSGIDGLFGTPEKLLFSEGFLQPWLTADGGTMYMYGNADIYVSYVPEPATILMFGIGAVLLRRAGQ